MSRRPPFRPVEWHIGDRILTNRRHTLIMGVVNVTPDSFSDGGRFADPDQAIRHGRALWDAGADLVDVGGESTRPGSEAVPGPEELARVEPVVSALTQEGIVVSIDTSKPEVAETAIAAGAQVVNDVLALQDPGLRRVVADSGVGVVLMHMQGRPRTMQDDPQYEDVVGDVVLFLRRRAEDAESAGVAPPKICLDPGIGFGKTLDHNLALLHRLDELVALGYPVLVGTSRKRFIGTLLGDVPVTKREIGTGASVALAIERGAAVVRVHDVAHTGQVVRVADAIVRGRHDEEAW